MLVSYYSLTGNIQKFLEKSNAKNILPIVTGKEMIHENSLLITSSIALGECPPPVWQFTKNNYHCIKGLIGSGNKNWGSLYCGAVQILSAEYNIPILLQFELTGDIDDIIHFNAILDGSL